MCAVRGRRVHRMAMYPIGVGATSTEGTSLRLIAAIGVLVVSHGQPDRHYTNLGPYLVFQCAVVPAACSGRMPDGSTAKAGTMINSASLVFWPPEDYQFLRTARIRRTVITANAAQPFQIVRFAPSTDVPDPNQGIAALRVKATPATAGHHNFATRQTRRPPAAEKGESDLRHRHARNFMRRPASGVPRGVVWLRAAMA